MPRAKRVEQKTRTIKVRESNALLIDQILKQRGGNLTYADIVNEVFEAAYPDSLRAVEQATSDIGAAIAGDEQRRKS